MKYLSISPTVAIAADRYRPIVDIGRHGMPSTASPRGNSQNSHSERKSWPMKPLNQLSVYYVAEWFTPVSTIRPGSSAALTPSMSVSNLSPTTKGARKSLRCQRIRQQPGCRLACHPGLYTGGRSQDGHHGAATGQQASLGGQRRVADVCCHVSGLPHIGHRPGWPTLPQQDRANRW